MMFDPEIGRLIEGSGSQIHKLRPTGRQTSERGSTMLAKETAPMVGRCEFANLISTQCPAKVIFNHQGPCTKRASGGFAALRTVACHRCFWLDIELVVHAAA